MGAAVYGIYHGLILLIPISRVVLLVAIGVGVCIYGAVLLLIGGVTKEELAAFPKGAMLTHIAEKLHLLSDETGAEKKKQKKRRKKKRKKGKREGRRGARLYEKRKTASKAFVVSFASAYGLQRRRRRRFA